MSRSTLPKSRAEKGGKATSATPAVTHEIVPGKYTDQDWNFMLDHDDGDDFIFDIVEEVCSSAMDIIFNSYIQKQLIPYTVCQAKDAILQIIEWQFLARDDGEQNVESAQEWAQDEEPEPAVTDCWAQGSVPKQHVTPRPASIMEEDEEPFAMEEVDTPIETSQQEEEETSPIVQQQEPLDDENSLPIEESDEESETKTPERTPESKKEEKPQAKRSGYKPHKGRLRSAGTGKMTESLEDSEMKMLHQQHSTPPTKSPDSDQLLMPASCHSILKLQAGRPPGNRDVLYDDTGNVISVFKLDPEKLPNHKVRTGFRVVDPSVEAAQARLEAMRTGRHVKSDMLPKPPSTNKPAGTRNASKTHTVTSVNSKYTGKDPNSMDVAPLPPPMIDTMELMPGVVVKEGDRIKRGPRPYNRKMEAVLGALHRNLKPMSGRADLPILSVAELLEHQTPVVKPLVDNTPIPPIAPQPQYS